MKFSLALYAKNVYTIFIGKQHNLNYIQEEIK